MQGKVLGHYHVEGELGSGGMGVVYQATDTRLHRSVAIKMLHDSFVRDGERVARFEREARVLASLNHANIAAIHGLEEVDGTRFLVMEFVPGKTLAELIGEKSLKLKKVLDFGLAKAVEQAPAAGTEAVTITTDATQTGMVMGTVAYMSPEQACGKPLDRRTDVWAFGCVLYEAVSGTRTFRGGTTTEVLAGILEREPDWNTLPAALPPNINGLMRRCLRKDLHSRLRDIGDARLEIEDALAGTTTGAVAVAQPKAARPWVLAVAVAGLLVATGAAGWIAYRAGSGKAPPARVTRFSIDVPENRSLIPSFNPQVALSRDTKSLLFGAIYNVPPPVNVLFRRRLDDLQSTVLLRGSGTPVFSPDDQWLILLDPGRGGVVRYPLGGGAPVPFITQMKGYSRGDWGADGYYYWTDAQPEGIVRKAISDGKTEQVVRLNDERQERVLKHAQLLPGGKALVFTVGYAGIDSFDDARIDAFDLRS